VGAPVIPLHGRSRLLELSGVVPTDVWRIARPDELPDGRTPLAWLVDPRSDRLPLGYGLYLRAGRDGSTPAPPDGAPLLQLPANLHHVGPGDVLNVSPDGSRTGVLWKASARHNSLLLTEQCDNLCIMCSQPPKAADDRWLIQRAKRVVRLLSEDVAEIGLTGGEPTLRGDDLLDLLRECLRVAPRAQVHLLSNGRRFSDPTFATQYANVGHLGLMVGIPLYAPEPRLHDYVVQADGAFDETVQGILNLVSLGQRVEIRVVVQKSTVPVLSDLAEFIARNLPFVEQVALMGLEMTGLARANHEAVWIDPADYREELAEAALRLRDAGLRTRVYNHQLCVLDRRLWPLAVRSISDWKSDYAAPCVSCRVKEECGGVFSTSRQRISSHLAPV
jgi:His-Xaa-Ser system radical SAM maturase HxsC